MKIDLASLLKRRGMKQSQLADRLGISRAYVSEMVSGKKAPSTEMIMRLAEALAVGPDEFFTTPDYSQSPDDQPGFREESDAYFASDADAEAARLQAMRAMTQGGTVCTLIANRSLPGFAILAGDKLVIDLGRKRTLGKLAAVTKADMQSGVATTFIKRIESQALYDHDALTPGERWQSKTYNYAVLGEVIGLIRGF
jgi:transcriptional regulator with XRE-family HTH domain